MFQFWEEDKSLLEADMGCRMTVERLEFLFPARNFWTDSRVYMEVESWRKETGCVRAGVLVIFFALLAVNTTKWSGRILN